MKPLNQYIDHTNPQAYCNPRRYRAAFAPRRSSTALPQSASIPATQRQRNSCLPAVKSRSAPSSAFRLARTPWLSKLRKPKMPTQQAAMSLTWSSTLPSQGRGRLITCVPRLQPVVAAAGGRTVKVIIETGLLTDEEKARATRLACSAGANFVKTCTGFSAGAATAGDIALMKANCADGVQLKASGGIKTYAAAQALIDAGADRLGTSSGAAIMDHVE